MALKLNRLGIYFLGLGIILLYFLYNRIEIIVSSNQTNGQIILSHQAGEAWLKNLTHRTCVQFTHDEFGSLYADNPDDYLALGSTVDVLYNKKSPVKAYIYTGYVFWARWFMFSLPFIIAWTAFAFSYINSRKVIIIKVPFTSKNKPKQ